MGQELEGSAGLGEGGAGMKAVTRKELRAELQQVRALLFSEQVAIKRLQSYITYIQQERIKEQKACDALRLEVEELQKASKPQSGELSRSQKQSRIRLGHNSVLDISRTS